MFSYAKGKKVFADFYKNKSIIFNSLNINVYTAKTYFDYFKNIY